jgi:histidine triad (HIT) family protein
MDNCIFCKISNKEVPSHKIFEDEYVIAFLDKHPINLGHVLVIPKQHEPDFYNLDDEIYSHLMIAVKKLANTVNTYSQPKKVGLIIAGWDVTHTHVHIVPMHDYHDITSKALLEGKRANLSEDELAKIASGLRILINY